MKTAASTTEVIPELAPLSWLFELTRNGGRKLICGSSVHLLDNGFLYPPSVGLGVPNGHPYVKLKPACGVITPA